MCTYAYVWGSRACRDAVSRPNKNSKYVKYLLFNHITKKL